MRRFVVHAFLMLAFASVVLAQETVVVPAQQPSAKNATQAKKPHPALLDPSKAVEKAPKKFEVLFQTTKGDFTLEIHRDWAPNGADRFYNLVRIGYFQEVAFFRAIEGFMVQFGIHGDPKVSKKWSEANIKDDPRKKEISNQPGYITFAKTNAPNSRSTQIFINLGNNANLDPLGFTPFGKISKGIENFKKLNKEYGENPRQLQGLFKEHGNVFIKDVYPKIDFIKSARIVEPKKEKPKTAATQ